MKQILREEDLPLTGEFRPSAVLGAISRAKNEMLDPTFLSENAANHRERTIARLADALPGAAAQGRTRSTSTTCCSRRSGSSTRRPTSSPSTRSAGATSTSTSTRTRTGRNTCGSRRSPRSTATSRVVGDDDQSIYSLARRRPAQHPRLRARLAGRDGRQARAELPLDPADPRRRPRGRLAQQRAQGQEALDRERAAALPIQRFEAYNEDEEAEWIARQVEGLVGGRGIDR